MVDYVFISGEQLQTGTHGETEYFYASGEPVVNAGVSDYVFESGVGVGGLGWESYTFCVLDDESSVCTFSGGSLTISTDPLFSFSHDGRSDISSNEGNSFWATRRKQSLGTPPWSVTFEGVEFTRNGFEDNWSVGVTDRGVGERPFENTEGSLNCIYMVDLENATGLNESTGREQNCVVINDGTKTETEVSWSYPADFTIEYDGSTATFKVDGSTVASLSAPNVDYTPAANLEDDNQDTSGNSATVQSYTETLS